MVLPTDRLRKHTGSVVTECAGELVFTFNNEFSWLTNKSVSLTMGQWPSQTRSPLATADRGPGIAPITPEKGASSEYRRTISYL